MKRSELKKLAIKFIGNDSFDSQNTILLKIATARCARVSYTVVGEEGKPDNYENDIKLHDRLLSMGHMSPFEHCGKAMSDNEYELWCSGLRTDKDGEKLHKYSAMGWCGNFRGFVQYRKILDGENKKDNRVISKIITQ